MAAWSLLWVSTASALVVLPSDGLIDPVPLAGQVAVQRDPGGELTIESMTNGAYAVGFDLQADANFSGVSRGVSWLRFSLARAVEAPVQWFIHMQPPSLNTVRLYAPDGLGGFTVTVLGDHVSYATREVKDLDLVVPIAIHSTLATYYLRIDSDEAATVLLSLWQQEGLRQLQAREQMLLGIVLGGILMMLFLNLIFWTWLRDSLYLHYAVLLLTAAGLRVFRSGYAAQWLYANPYLSVHGLGICICTFNVVATMFLVRLFEFRKHAPWAWQAFRVVAVFNVLALVVALGGRYAGIAQWAVLIFVASTLLGALSVLYVFVVRRQYQFLIPAVAFAPVVVMATILRLQSLDALDLAFGSSVNVIGQLSTLIYLILFNIAIANRTRVAERGVKDEKRKAYELARRAETELEVKVGQRTQALVRTGTVLKAEIKRRLSLEVELRKSLRTEQLARAQQRDFVTMVSHEFRTPLSIIDATAQSLGVSPLGKSPEIAPRAAKIRRAVHRLSLLLNNVLAADRLDPDVVTRASVARFALHDLIRSVQASIPSEAGQRVRVRTFPSAASVMVVGDRTLLEIALQNLVQNALTYSGLDRPIVVAVSVNAGIIWVDVSDSGAGIDVSDQTRIFKKYFRSDVHRTLPGSGLGLHIAREIARQHGGDVALVFSHAQGSQFRLLLPMK
jgi:signal transduction histidine kinase